MNRKLNWRISARHLATAALAAATLVSATGTVWAAGAERSLAGISIFAPGSAVTRKFGNPNRILVGGVAPGAAAAGGASGSGGSSSGYPGSSSSGYPGSSSSGSGSQTRGAGLLPGFGGISTNPYGSSSSYGGGGGGSSEYPGASSSYGGGGGGYPGSSGGYPGSSSSGYPGSSGGSGGVLGGAPAAPVQDPVTLVYDRANGGTLEFTISPDKRVVQIRETGYSGAYGTSRGIRLGTSYAAVVGKYGYPENTFISGPIINIDYKGTLHAGFQFLDQKLVAIIVAAPD